MGRAGCSGVFGPGGLPSPVVTTHRQGYPDGSDGGGYRNGYPDSASGYPSYPEQGQPGQGAVPSSGVPQGWPDAASGYGERRFAESIPRYPDGGYPGGQGGQQGHYQEDLRLDAGDLGGQQGPGGGLDSPTTVTPAHPGTASGGGSNEASLGDMLSSPTEMVDAYQPPAQQQGADAGVYRSGGRPTLALVLAIAVIVLEVPVAVLLVRSMMNAGGIAVGGLVAGLFLLPGLPIFAAGLYGVFTGKVTARPGDGWAAVVRPPMAALLAGALFLVCAALAAG